MNHPLRENLEVLSEGQGIWIRCTKCFHVLCRMGEDWKRVCKSSLFPPTKAVPLIGDLAEGYLIEQLYCPSCAALLNTELVGDGDSNKIERTD